MRLLDLPVWLRAYGLEVVEVPGWRTRGAALDVLPTTVIGHHTGTSGAAVGKAFRDLPTLAVLRDGRSDLPGPLCQVAIGRTGTAYVIAAGKANHAGRGAWNGCTDSARTVGIEVEHPGTGPWSPTLLQSFDRTAAALLDGLGQSAARYCGHREWALPAGRKVDPGGVDLRLQRDRIRALLMHGPTTRVPPTSEDVMASIEEVRAVVREEVARLSGGPRRRDAAGNVIDNDPQTISVADVYTLLEQVRAEVRQLKGGAA